VGISTCQIYCELQKLVLWDTYSGDGVPRSPFAVVLVGASEEAVGELVGAQRRWGGARGGVSDLQLGRAGERPGINKVAFQSKRQRYASEK